MSTNEETPGCERVKSTTRAIRADLYPEFAADMAFCATPAAASAGTTGCDQCRPYGSERLKLPIQGGKRGYRAHMAVAHGVMPT